MIIDNFIIILNGFLSILLAPLEAINIGVDFIASIPIVTSFLQIIAYVLPWNNILPLIILTIAIFLFRIVIAFIKLVLDVLPFT